MPAALLNHEMKDRKKDFFFEKKPCPKRLSAIYYITTYTQNVEEQITAES